MGSSKVYDIVSLIYDLQNFLKEMVVKLLISELIKHSTFKENLYQIYLCIFKEFGCVHSNTNVQLQRLAELTYY